MASTYINNLRLEEIGTGEASGTWGTKTNVNLELIGEALGYGTEAITTNADTHASTVDDGASDPARSMYLKYTGTLDSTCTVTIGPETVSRVMFIENATSGSQSLIIKQGSGATVTIANAKTKIVYLDGAGTGAAVVDALATLENFITTGTAASLTQLNITSQGDLRLEDSSGSEYAALQAAATTTTYTITLPAAKGTSGQVLTLSDGDGATVWGDLGSSGIADSSITTAKIADDAVTQAKIADDAVGSDQLAGSLTVDINGGSIDGTPIGASSASTVVATQVDITAEGDLRLQDAASGEYVALEAPATIASSYTLELPAADGSSGQALVTNGSGVLSFAATSGATPVSGFFDVTATDLATYSVSGLSFQPSLIVFNAFGGATVTGGQPAYFSSSHGFATGTGTNQETVSSRILNSPAVEYGVVKNTAYCWWINNYDGEYNLGQVTAIASDGFTVTSGVANGTTATVMYTAYP